MKVFRREDKIVPRESKRGSRLCSACGHAEELYVRRSKGPGTSEAGHAMKAHYLPGKNTCSCITFAITLLPVFSPPFSSLMLSCSQPFWLDFSSPEASWPPPSLGELSLVRVSSPPISYQLLSWPTAGLAFSLAYLALSSPPWQQELVLLSSAPQRAQHPSCRSRRASFLEPAQPGKDALLAGAPLRPCAFVLAWPELRLPHRGQPSLRSQPLSLGRA